MAVCVVVSFCVVEFLQRSSLWQPLEPAHAADEVVAKDLLDVARDEFGAIARAEA
jgi:hypothetical protein